MENPLRKMAKSAPAAHSGVPKSPIAKASCSSNFIQKQNDLTGQTCTPSSLKCSRDSYSVLDIRIRVCLQAYHKSRQIDSASAPESAPLSSPTEFLAELQSQPNNPAPEGALMPQANG